MVKAYLRYELNASWGVISSNSNVCYDRTGKVLVTASLENVSVWDVKKAILVRSLVPPLSESGKIAGEVTQLAASPVADQVAVGHADGTVRVWDLQSGECACTFSGHRGAVSALRFSPSGALLASGSRDTDVVLWDVVADAGLYRLRGHRDQVTGVAFLGGGGAGRLATCSKDELLKVWDLDTQHCCQTVVGHRGEVWALDLDPSGTRLATGATDAEVRLYRVDADGAEVLTPMGSLRRAAAERAATVQFAAAPDGSVLLGCQGAGKVGEVWRLRGEAEAKKRQKRRAKRRAEKAAKKDAEKAGSEGEVGGGAARHAGLAGRAAARAAEAAEAAEAEQPLGLAAGDEFELVATLRSKHKVRAAAFCPPQGRRASAPARLVVSLANNSLEVWELPAGAGDGAEDPERAAAQRAQTIDGGGHRSDVRAVALSSDDAMCLSASSAGVKVWNPRSGACLRTMESGYALCALWAPGNRHAVVGTKQGTLEIFDVGASTRVEVVEAHEGPVWSLCALPHGAGFVSGSADKAVKFWEWDVVAPPPQDGAAAATAASGGALSRLGVTHTRTLKMTDDVLCVRVSPDGRLLAVALLDSTVRVFFVDSLKFFLSLYGHKLPVLCMDISSDGTLLATGSADKNIKLWGLDFGDCHRSLFAHADSVMALAFVPGTHYLFSASKDKKVKYWDADKWELLLTLEGHHGEVWALAVSSLGDFVVSGSHDRSLRRWERTEEPFFVEEEQEKRLESMFEADLENADRAPLGQEPPGEGGAVAPAGRKTLETVGAADAIIDALDLAAAEEERAAEFREQQERRRRRAAEGAEAEAAAAAAAAVPLPPNPLLLGASPSEHVLSAVARVRGGELEQALLLLPFADALRLLGYLVGWLRRGARVELLARVAVLLVRLHMQQLSATPSARALLIELQCLLRERVQWLKDTVGFNLAALGHLQRAVTQRQAQPTVEAAAAAVLPLKRRKLAASA